MPEEQPRQLQLGESTAPRSAPRLRVFALGNDGRLVDLLKQTEGGGGSKQLKGDPFTALYGEMSLLVPPYDFEPLLELRELCPVHSAWTR